MDVKLPQQAKQNLHFSSITFDLKVFLNHRYTHLVWNSSSNSWTSQWRSHLHLHLDLHLNTLTHVFLPLVLSLLIWGPRHNPQWGKRQKWDPSLKTSKKYPISFNKRTQVSSLYLEKLIKSLIVKRIDKSDSKHTGFPLPEKGVLLIIGFVYSHTFLYFWELTKDCGSTFQQPHIDFSIIPIGRTVSGTTHLVQPKKQSLDRVMLFVTHPESKYRKRVMRSVVAPNNTSDTYPIQTNNVCIMQRDRHLQNVNYLIACHGLGPFDIDTYIYLTPDPRHCIANHHLNNLLLPLHNLWFWCYFLPTGSEEREVLEVGSISVTILPSCHILVTSWAFSSHWYDQWMNKSKPVLVQDWISPNLFSLWKLP